MLRLWDFVWIWESSGPCLGERVCFAAGVFVSEMTALGRPAPVGRAISRPKS